MEWFLVRGIYTVFGGLGDRCSRRLYDYTLTSFVAEAAMRENQEMLTSNVDIKYVVVFIFGRQEG
jgi:hypothetical protein